jgi:hypothetical protein
VINLFGLAIRHELTADDLKSTIFAYPTGASDIGYIACGPYHFAQWSPLALPLQRQMPSP